MVADARAGRIAEGRVRGACLLPLVEALFAEPSPAVLKAVLHAQGRIATPTVRMPLAPASDDGRRTALVRLPVPALGRA